MRATPLRGGLVAARMAAARSSQAGSLSVVVVARAFTISRRSVCRPRAQLPRPFHSIERVLGSRSTPPASVPDKKTPPNNATVQKCCAPMSREVGRNTHSHGFNSDSSHVLQLMRQLFPRFFKFSSYQSNRFLGFWNENKQWKHLTKTSLFICPWHVLLVFYRLDGFLFWVQLLEWK